ncbi:MAG: porin [Woeseiaceae bacterium]|nr:porin [Woeseiaceae bacterium]
MRGARYSLLPVFLLLALRSAHAGVLPEDRSDVLYHLYDGGGVEIDGPSVLVRKQVAKSLSVVGNYYVDMVSSASIDVVTTASPYTEERKQWSLGADYLRGNTTMSLGYTSSEESDFDAETWSLSVSQDMFGDLTTLSLSYALGDDVVGRSDDETFARDNTRQHYGIGVTQILTRNLITTLNVETITDEGFLNNPYRSVRYADSGSATGYSFEPELYPATRTSNAVGLRARYFLPYRAALQGEYRFFTDTWNIDSHTAAIAYVHPLGPWTLRLKYRWHDQTGAEFFNDLFPRAEATNFRARDKELSPLTSTTITLSASYEFLSQGWGFVDKGSVNLSVDLLNVDYHEFSDLTADAPVGSEPLYQLDASIFQLYFSFWY